MIHSSGPLFFLSLGGVVGRAGVGIGGRRGIVGVERGGFCGIGGGTNRRWVWDRRGAKRSWWCVAQRGVLWRWWASGWGSARRGAADGWGSAVFVAQRVRIGGQRTIIGVGIGGQRTINGVRNDCGGAARSAGFCGVSGRAGRHRQRGGGKCMTTWGDSGQPLPRYEPWWRHESPLPALVAPRIPTTTLGGTSQHHHAHRWHLAGARRPYRGRGRPESPPIPSRRLNRRWRCRPARPPTSRNTPLRDAPPRSIRTRLRPHRASIPTPISTNVPKHPAARRPTTIDSHPSAAPSRADSHPQPPPTPQTPRCATPSDAPIRSLRHRPLSIRLPL
jgi:hypothetical protein